MKQYSSKNISLNGSEAEAKRAEILGYFLKTYELYERLFDLLADDSAFYEQPESLRHPLIFYFGHTAVFYINKLVLSKKLFRINQRYESIFAIGVDEMSWDDLNQTNYKWPSVAEARDYRAKAKDAVVDFIKNEPLSLPIGWDDPFWIVLMGIEHERIHLETSSVLIRQLDISKVKWSNIFAICEESSNPPQNELLQIPPCHVSLGKNSDGEFYGWDNEYGTHEAGLQSFYASKYLVTNAEFLEFVDDGGYDSDDLWEEEGLEWKKYTSAKHPSFWVVGSEEFQYRTLNEIIEMPLDWPVDVNYHEAKAYCNWLSKRQGKHIRLPSEAEWHAIADFAGVDDDGIDTGRLKANINLTLCASASPVTKFAHGDFYDVVGNVWQWCETPIYGFEGFRTHPMYDDFSEPTFDGRHNIIKGGSFISTGNELLTCSRYAFRRHFIQHAGFRYVVSDNEITSEKSIYETDEAISQYLEFHYGEEYFDVRNFPSKIAEIAISVSDSTAQKRALDIGCSVGRCSFELARVFDEVVGLDFSARFIRCAEELKNRGKLSYLLKTEGDTNEPRGIDANELNITPEQRSRVHFWQADGCNMKPIFAGYDLVVAANLIDRLYDPIGFLSQIHTRLTDGGVLLLTSPYSWSEDYTAKDKWLCDSKTSSLARIREILSGQFDEIFEPMDVEFVIRESARKFQHTISQVTVWQKR